MHPINGTWKIIADCPLGKLPSVDELKVEGDSFSGIMHDEKSGKDYAITNGKMNGNDVTFKAEMKFGFVTMAFDLQGHISEDGKHCTGTAHAMKMNGTFEGEKISDEVSF